TAAMRPLRDIGPDQDAAAALLFDRLPSLFRVFVLFQIDDGDICALARKQHRYGAADARIAAGDEGDLALQLARADIIGCVIHGSGLELALVARLALMLLRKGRLGILAGTGLHNVLLPAFVAGFVSGFYILLDGTLLGGFAVGV